MNLQKPPAPIRDRKHVKFVAGLSCCIPGCGRQSGPPHHLLRTPEKCAGRKSGDDKVLPMCPDHHHALHMNGDETEFLKFHGIDGPALAAALYEATGDYEQACAILRGIQE
jgi:hypothetical protein